MKYVMIKAIFIGIVVSSCSAQEINEKKVPSVVLNTVKAKYPVTTEIDWKKVKSVYEAEIDINDSVEVTLQVDQSGKLMATKEDIANTDLLPVILSTVKDTYPGYTIDDAELIDRNGIRFYQVDLDAKNKKDIQLVFTAEGRLDTSTGYWN